MPTITLTKHHALGNDFLVVFDDQALPRRSWETLARLWCDRRRGIGADGLLVGVTEPAGGADLGMLLFNADGSRAEMSGNGIRCLAQAAVPRFGGPPVGLHIATDAGLREVWIEPTEDRLTVLASVEMGRVADVDAPAGWPVLTRKLARLGGTARAVSRHVSIGNPHSILLVDDVRAVDLAALGALVPDINLEVVAAGPERDAITMRVHERGAGITEACGTGACAAARVAADAGLLPSGIREITVHMDGGDAKVHLGADLVLVGPATFVATIEVPVPGAKAVRG